MQNGTRLVPFDAGLPICRTEFGMDGQNWFTLRPARSTTECRRYVVQWNCQGHHQWHQQTDRHTVRIEIYRKRIQGQSWVFYVSVKSNTIDYSIGHISKTLVTTCNCARRRSNSSVAESVNTESMMKNRKWTFWSPSSLATTATETCSASLFIIREPRHRNARRANIKSSPHYVLELKNTRRKKLPFLVSPVYRMEAFAVKLLLQFVQFFRRILKIQTQFSILGTFQCQHFI